MLRSRWHRFGYACVNFGTPVSMRGYLGERGLDFRHLSQGGARRGHLEQLGDELMAAIGGVVPVLPVPLVATRPRAQRRRAALRAGAQGADVTA